MRYNPLQHSMCTLSSPFGPRSGGFHRGQDFAAADGTPIFAAQTGTVAHIGPAAGFGQWIVLDHPNSAGGGSTVYGHMWNAFATGLKKGDHVRAGQQIGFVGSNGDSSGPHLHFEVHPKAWSPGSQIDPRPWLEHSCDPQHSNIAAATQDTLFADVSEWQRPIDDSYPYRVVTIRSNDGDYRDRNWDLNYSWCKTAANTGRLECFIVYFVYRPNWEETVATFQMQVGEPHPKMAVMIDVESWGGQISGDQSNQLNRCHHRISEFLGDPRRVIGYGNATDLNTLWPQRPQNLKLVLAAYGSNPPYPGKIAHQYTDGRGYGGGLPEGAAPFGRCDMNSADGLEPRQLAATLGIGSAPGARVA